jgi:hypothetical protein
MLPSAWPRALTALPLPLESAASSGWTAHAAHLHAGALEPECAADPLLKRVVIEVCDVGGLPVPDVIVVLEPIAEPLYALREWHLRVVPQILRSHRARLASSQRAVSSWTRTFAGWLRFTLRCERSEHNAAFGP